MSKISQHVQEQQEKEDLDGPSCRWEECPHGAECVHATENEHAKLIRQKWPMGGWPTKSDDHKS